MKLLAGSLMIISSLNISLLVLLACFSTILLTYLVKKLASRYRIVNEPSERGLHSTSTPRAGGLAIIIVWYIGITFFYIKGVIDDNLYPALMSGAILAVVGLVDDIVEVKPITRLIIQFIVAILAFYFLGGLRKPITFGIDILTVPFIVYPITIVGMVWFINLFNFMDGADGFASIEAILVGLVLYIFTGSLELLLLASSVLGFLYWNWPKAKIFMGDVGSTQIGFILVVLGIHYHNTLDFSIFNWMMITAPFWFDASLTLFRRWQNREQLSRPHRKHAYQRFILAGNSHEKLDIALIVVNVIIFLLILVYREWDLMKIPVYFITLVFLYSLVRRIDKLFPFNSE
jgi:Fuc2NAc and GlcNAc transferase